MSVILTWSFSFLIYQRVWRRYSELKKVSQQLQEEWEALVVQYGGCITKQWISNKLLRPFLFIAMQSTTSYKKQQLRKMNYVSACFKILLSSINSYGMPFFSPFFYFLFLLYGRANFIWPEIFSPSGGEWVAVQLDPSPNLNPKWSLDFNGAYAKKLLIS